MEQLFKKFLSLTLVATTGALLADCTSCTNGCGSIAKPVTCFVPRSQSFHNELKNAAMDPDNQFLFDADGCNGTFNVMFEYNDTFNNNDLARCLFGPATVCIQGPNKGCENMMAINIVGTEAATPPNGITDLVADNFFLPKDFSSTVTVKPSIENFNIHFQLYFGFDRWCDGLYLRLYGPVSISRWQLETKETINSRGTVGYVAGEIAPVDVGTDDLFGSFLSYAQGNLIPNGDDDTPGQLPGSVAPLAVGPTVAALKYNRFGGCQTDTTTQFADLRAELGWNFVLDEDYHFGLYIAAAAPTGDDCEGDCDNLLWGAKAGNGQHWELGGGLTAHYTICRSQDCERQLDFFVDATINHMFAHTELRTFDLKDANGNNKPLSRYIIAEQLGDPTNALTYGDQGVGTLAKYQFNSAYAPVANFSTIPVSVSFPVQADVMAKFVYTCRGFSWALGYDFWAQACPNVEIGCDDSCNPFQFPTNTWALRGDAHVYGFGYNSDDALETIQPIPATYNATTAFNIGTAFEGASATPNENEGVDSSFEPLTVNNSSTPLLVADGGVPGNLVIYGSNPPTFIAQADLDTCNVTRGMSNSIFTEFNYTWLNCDCYVPYLGIGARVEFGQNSETPVNNVNATPINNNPNSNCCDSCGTCTATVWGLWIKGGISFN